MTPAESFVAHYRLKNQAAACYCYRRTFRLWVCSLGHDHDQCQIENLIFSFWSRVTLTRMISAGDSRTRHVIGSSHVIKNSVNFEKINPIRKKLRNNDSWIFLDFIFIRLSRRQKLKKNKNWNTWNSMIAAIPWKFEILEKMRKLQFWMKTMFSLLFLKITFLIMFYLTVLFDMTWYIDLDYS